MSMSSNKPYLIRAIYDWIIDNNLTPYLLVNALFPDIQIPETYVNQGKIVLNISPAACKGLHLENDRIVFMARFEGKVEQIFLTPQAVLAIYAKENGRGMEFGEEYTESQDTQNQAPAKTGSKPRLSLVKKDNKED